jgi:hypothetical protein
MVGSRKLPFQAATGGRASEGMGSAMGYEERKIGETTFLVFADGMVNAADVREVQLMADGKVSIGLKSGWLTLRQQASLPREKS